MNDLKVFFKYKSYFSAPVAANCICEFESPNRGAIVATILSATKFSINFVSVAIEANMFSPVSFSLQEDELICE